MTKHISSTQQALLRTGIDQIGLEVSDGAMSNIEHHLALVYKWRSMINLISITDERDLITHHALDSLVIVPLLAQSKRVLDIGSGAGFPGLQLASVCPKTSFTLLDSRQRRVEFMRMVTVAIGLENVALSTGRIERHQPVSAQGQAGVSPPYDTLVARAVASLETLLKLTRHLHFPGQRLIAMKGVYPTAEIKEIERQAHTPIREVTVERLEVPYLQAQRHAVIIHF